METLPYIQRPSLTQEQLCTHHSHGFSGLFWTHRHLVFSARCSDCVDWIMGPSPRLLSTVPLPRLPEQFSITASVLIYLPSLLPLSKLNSHNIILLKFLLSPVPVVLLWPSLMPHPLAMLLSCTLPTLTHFMWPLSILKPPFSPFLLFFLFF